MQTQFTSVQPSYVSLHQNLNNEREEPVTRKRSCQEVILKNPTDKTPTSIEEGIAAKIGFCYDNDRQDKSDQFNF